MNKKELSAFEESPKVKSLLESINKCFDSTPNMAKCVISYSDPETVEMLTEILNNEGRYNAYSQSRFNWPERHSSDMIIYPYRYEVIVSLKR